MRNWPRSISSATVSMATGTMWSFRHERKLSYVIFARRLTDTNAIQAQLNIL